MFSALHFPDGSDVQRKDGMELLFAPEEVQADRELVTLALPISVHTPAAQVQRSLNFKQVLV